MISSSQLVCVFYKSPVRHAHGRWFMYVEFGSKHVLIVFARSLQSVTARNALDSKPYFILFVFFKFYFSRIRILFIYYR